MNFNFLTGTYGRLAFLLLSLLFTALLPNVNASNVIELDFKNFDNAIGGEDAVFVEFYASWCGHCKNLAPIYEQLGDAFKNKKGIKIVKIDADKNRVIGSQYDIKGFPTLKFFPKESTTPEEYNGGRDLDALASFIQSKTGIIPSIEKPHSDVLELTDANFYTHVGKDKNILVEFFATWCGHCKNLAPIYEKVATTFVSESKCAVAKINAEDHSNSSSTFGIKGFPTLKYFPAGSITPVDYTGGRTEEDFISFLNEQCGTGRAVGGGIVEGFGTIKDLENLFEQYLKADKEATKAAISTLKTTVKELELNDKYAKYYGKVVDKIETKGIDYVTKELSRISSIIEKQKDSIDPTKRDSFYIRKNILSNLQSIISGSVIGHSEL